jgi:predicted GNAT family N-acyltransferase
MNIGEIQKDGTLYKKAFELRYLLFFKDYNLSKEIINDKTEDISTHIAISKERELIAYGRLSELSDKEFQISQMVVSPIHQHQGYGEKLLLEIVQTAKNKGAKNIMLNARTTAVSFYKKSGFQQVGQVYSSQSTGVPHIKMVYHENS